MTMKSLASERFRRTFLVFYALSALLPFLILLYVLFQHIAPTLTAGQLDGLREVAAVSLAGILVIQVLGFFLMSWWIRGLEDITRDIRSRSLDLLGRSPERSGHNEMMALKNVFDGLYRELQDKIVQINDYSQRLVASSQRLSEMAITDELTGLYNRRHFEDRLREESARADRHGYSLALLMIDVDGFKKYNDGFGHPAGDSLLAGLGALIREGVRRSDVAFRYGGDEFAVLMPECPAKGARQTAGKLVESFAAFAAGESGDGKGGVSLSCGATLYAGDVGAFVEVADKALYQAKAAGKGRVVYLEAKGV